MQFKVLIQEDGISLLQILKGRLKSLSGKEIKRAIDESACLVNGKVERHSSSKLEMGDKVLFHESRIIPKSAPDFELLYKDDHFSAWYKPPFYTVDTSRFTVHRLDKETSGILLESSLPEFVDLFRNREMQKVYYAICQGRPHKDEGVVTNYLQESFPTKGRKVMVVGQGGKLAKTRWKSCSL